MARVHSRSGSPPKPSARERGREGGLVAHLSKILIPSPREGIESVNSVLRHNQKADDYYDMAMTFLRLGELEQAESCFKDALNLEPGDGDTQKALDLTRKAMRILGGTEELQASDLDWMGTVLHIARDGEMFELALKVGEKMVEVDTGGGALNDLGLVYLSMDQNDKALECFDRALQIEPDMPEALVQKALCLMIDEKYDEASALYTRALQSKPDFPQGWYNLGVISIRKENYEEAIRLLDKAIGLNDEYYMAWFAKFQALERLRRTADAERCLKRAMALNPSYVMKSLAGKGIDRHTSNIHAKWVRP